MRRRYSRLLATSSPSILVILMGSLGDLVRGLALSAHLKHALPECHLTWLVEPKWESLVRFQPLVDSVLVFDRPRGLRAVLSLHRQFRRLHFDISLDLQRISKSGIFAWLSGARRRIGFHPRNSKEFNWLFNTESIPYQPGNFSKLRHYLSFADHLELPLPQRVAFGFEDIDPLVVAPRLKSLFSQAYIVVVMGSTWESKNWYFEGYLELISRILELKTHRVVLVGDHSQSALSRRLGANFKSSEVINLAGKTSLIELMAVLKAARVCVGPDSGPTHMACAVATPYVCLFGPTSPQRVAPYGSLHLVLQIDLDCIGCYKRRCPDRGQRCMRDITAEMVMQKLELALGSRPVVKTTTDL